MILGIPAKKEERSGNFVNKRERDFLFLLGWNAGIVREKSGTRPPSLSEGLDPPVHCYMKLVKKLGWDRDSDVQRGGIAGLRK